MATEHPQTREDGILAKHSEWRHFTLMVNSEAGRSPRNVRFGVRFLKHQEDSRSAGVR